MTARVNNTGPTAAKVPVAVVAAALGAEHTMLLDKIVDEAMGAKNVALDSEAVERLAQDIEDEQPSWRPTDEQIDAFLRWRREHPELQPAAAEESR
jgi:hypothetical protein